MSYNYKSRKSRRHLKNSVAAAASVIVIAAIVITAVAVKARFGKPSSSKSPSVSANISSVSSSSKVSSSSAVSSSQSSSSDDLSSYSGPTTKRIPVLMYHSINYEKGNPLRIPKDKFAAQMKWLHDNGYRTLSLDELYYCILNSKPFPEKSVVITFDDGYNDNYDNAFPVIKKYGFKATVFMITKEIGDNKNGYLTAEQIKEMDANGMRVECHTVDHPDLSKQSYDEQYKELADSKATLEKLLGRSIDYIAYPSGEYNANTIKIAKKLGYKICFKENGGTAEIGDNQYEFPRKYIIEDMQKFIARVTAK